MARETPELAGGMPLPLSLRSDFPWRDAKTPNMTQAPSAIHSYLEKCPGTRGTIFIKASAVATSNPKPATVRSQSFVVCIDVPDIARYAAHVAAHPIAHATEPT